MSCSVVWDDDVMTVLLAEEETHKRDGTLAGMDLVTIHEWHPQIDSNKSSLPTIVMFYSFAPIAWDRPQSS